MLNKVKAFFSSQLSGSDEVIDATHERQLAAATLCVEVMRADYQVDQSEIASVLLSLRQQFGLNEQEAKDLLALAESKADGAASLHPFTSLINAEYTLEEKIELVEILWRVVLADNEKDKYEEHLVRKIAELLYVPHTAFVQARHRAEK